MSQALKHIGSLQMPERSQVYGKSGLQGPIEELEAKGVLRYVYFMESSDMCIPFYGELMYALENYAFYGLVWCVEL